MIRAPLWLRRLSCRLVGHRYLYRTSQYGRRELRLRIRRGRCRICWHRAQPKVSKRPKQKYHKGKTMLWPTPRWDDGNH